LAGARWLASYSDAQIQFPERFTIALLKDAVAAADEQGNTCDVLPRHRATLNGAVVSLTDVTTAEVVREFAPAAIINATGAWVDRTLQRLQIASPRLIGGTKGSHFLTWHAGLRDELRGQAVYAEAADGRPIFLLPLGAGTLVGTTDIPYDGDPADAVATNEELDYLLAAVQRLLPQCDVTRDDIALSGCGVRPLPYVSHKSPAGVTRRHALAWHDDVPAPLVSVIGGKLTTCRSLAEETAHAILSRLDRPWQTGRTQSRPLSREVSLPTAADAAQLSQDAIARFHTDEWATTLEDLVERRLMWLYDPQLNLRTLDHLARAWQAAGNLPPDDAAIDAAVRRCAARLATHFGRRLV
jgi:glycerol-3-phosphate dehydrogenase